LSQTSPRLITTGRVVAVGTSGGVTRLGTLVAFGGALLIGVLVFFSLFVAPDVIAPRSRAWFLLPIIIAVAGLIGSLFDSLLGATVQAIYYCDFDQKETESAVHRCGRATRLIRGWRWLDNDWVNFLASAVGSGIAVLGYWVIR
jgi:uncharacterized membrane protein